MRGPFLQKTDVLQVMIYKDMWVSGTKSETLSFNKKLNTSATIPLAIPKVGSNTKCYTKKKKKIKTVVTSINIGKKEWRERDLLS